LVVLEVGIFTWMGEVRVECHAGYRGDKTPRRFHLEGQTVEIVAVLDRWKEPRALFFRVRSLDGRVFVLRRDEQAGRWDIPRWRADGSSRGYDDRAARDCEATVTLRR